MGRHRRGVKTKGRQWRELAVGDTIVFSRIIKAK